MSLAAHSDFQAPEGWPDLSDRELKAWFNETHGYTRPHGGLEAWVLSARVTDEMLEGLRPAAIPMTVIRFFVPYWDGEDDPFGD